jgi:pyruvate dehydrogenase E1 component beta subunit
VHEAHRTCGAGAEIAAALYETAFQYLDEPIERLGARQCPLPFNLGLENAVVPQAQDIREAIKRTLHL